jgi:hypothetical protein
MRERAPRADLASLHILALERPANLSRADTRRAVIDAVTALPWRPAAILIDTMSKFSAGVDENDNGEVAAFLSGLGADFRDALGCTVLLIVHTGHGDVRRPRGASALMCNPDAEYIVTRPDAQGMGDGDVSGSRTPRAFRHWIHRPRRRLGRADGKAIASQPGARSTDLRRRQRRQSAPRKESGSHRGGPHGVATRQTRRGAHLDT